MDSLVNNMHSTKILSLKGRNERCDVWLGTKNETQEQFWNVADLGRRDEDEDKGCEGDRNKNLQ